MRSDTSGVDKRVSKSHKNNTRLSFKTSVPNPGFVFSHTSLLYSSIFHRYIFIPARTT